MVLNNHKKLGLAGAGTHIGEAPAPTKLKQKAHNLSTQGRKPRHRSTKAEIDHERMAAKVITCLCAGKTIEETAMELDISITWGRRVRDELPEDFTAQFTQAKSNKIGALIEEMLEAHLKAMIKMVGVTDDDIWLKAQRARELAIFFGVINDKTFRVLAAIERADERLRVEQSYISETNRLLEALQHFDRNGRDLDLHKRGEQD